MNWLRDPQKDAERVEAALRPYFEEALGVRIVPRLDQAAADAPLPITDEDEDEVAADLALFRFIMGR